MYVKMYICVCVASQFSTVVSQGTTVVSQCSLCCHVLHCGITVIHRNVKEFLCAATVLHCAFTVFQLCVTVLHVVSHCSTELKNSVLL